MNPIKHMAIIMDGNGRWGLKHKNSRNLGHKEGLKTVEMVIKYCIKKKIKFLPSRAGERYASALTNMNLSNKVYRYFGKKELKDYISHFVANN